MKDMNLYDFVISIGDTVAGSYIYSFSSLNNFNTKASATYNRTSLQFNISSVSIARG